MELKLVESKEELQQILDLQNANHVDNVSSNIKKQEGFVTVKHNIELLTRMNTAAPQVIAVDQGKVIGYALVMLKDFKNMIPILEPMYSTFDDLIYDGVKLTTLDYYVMGQVCIDKDYRGAGVFHALYKKHNSVFSPKYDLCLTEVSTSNPRSMRAHLKVGFKILKTYQDASDEWNILSWDWN